MKNTSVFYGLSLLAALIVLPALPAMAWQRGNTLLAASQREPSSDEGQMNTHPDTITIIINNTIKEVKPASPFPDTIRYRKRRILDKDGNKTKTYKKVPVRFIKKYYIGNGGKLVENIEDSHLIITEYLDENKTPLMVVRGVRKNKKNNNL